MAMPSPSWAQRPPVDELLALFDSLIVKQGTTTAAGAGAGNSIIDASLIGAGANSFLNMVVVLYPSDALRADAANVTGFNNGTGELTLSKAYKGVAAPVPLGVPYVMLSLVLSVSGVIADLNVPAADAVTNLLERDVIGNKTDTAITTPDNVSAQMRYLKGLMNIIGYQGATALANKLTAARAAKLDNLSGTVTTGVFALVNNILEQDCLVFPAAYQQVDVELDMNALANTITVREYVQVDGANYRQISAKVFPTNFDAGTKAVILSFVQKNSLYKITLQEAVGEAQNIPYRYMVRSLA